MFFKNTQKGNTIKNIFTPSLVKNDTTNEQVC